MTASDHLSGQQFVHTTNAELNPGDEILPAAQIGHQSRWSKVPRYNPNKVYLSGEGVDPVSWDQHGKHSYAVKPVGKVERNPEFLDDKAADDEGMVDEDHPSFHTFTADKAIVVRKIAEHKEQPPSTFKTRPSTGKQPWFK